MKRMKPEKAARPRNHRARRGGENATSQEEPRAGLLVRIGSEVWGIWEISAHGRSHGFRDRASTPTERAGWCYAERAASSA